MTQANTVTTTKKNVRIIGKFSGRHAIIATEFSGKLQFYFGVSAGMAQVAAESLSADAGQIISHKLAVGKTDKSGALTLRDMGKGKAIETYSLAMARTITKIDDLKAESKCIDGSQFKGNFTIGSQFNDWLSMKFKEQCEHSVFITKEKAQELGLWIEREDRPVKECEVDEDGNIVAVTK
jgi:hypothetical protein